MSIHGHDLHVGVAQFAGPQGEGKHRVDPRQWPFNSKFDRAHVKKSDEYKYRLGPGAYYRGNLPVEQRGPLSFSLADRFEAPDPNSSVPSRLAHEDYTVSKRGVRQPFAQAERFDHKVSVSTCKVDFYNSADVSLRLAQEQAERMVCRSAFVSETERFDGARDVEHLGPGSYDLPDSTSLREHPKASPWPVFVTQTTQPSIPFDERYGDPGIMGPGFYYRPEADAIVRDPTRPTSAFMASGRDARALQTTDRQAQEFKSGWSLASEGRTWRTGGSTSAGCAISTSQRFERVTRAQALPWRSNDASRSMLQEARRRHERNKKHRRRRRSKSRGSSREGGSESGSELGASFSGRISEPPMPIR